MHAIYLVALTVYIALTFMGGHYGESQGAAWPALMVSGVAYSTVYDLIQAWKEGWDYLKDAWNYTDVAFNCAGLINVIF